MKRDDVTARSQDDLLGAAVKLEEALFQLRLDHSLGKLKKTSDLCKTRRERARILTELKKRELAKGV